MTRIASFPLVREGARSPWMLLVSTIVLVSLALAGCGGGGGGTSTSPPLTTVDSPTGTVSLELQYGGAAKATKSASAANTVRGIPAEASSFLVRVIDDAGNDLIDPMPVTREVGRASQTVTITRVPVGEHQVLIEMYAADGGTLGYGPPAQITVTSAATIQVVVSHLVTVTSVTVTPPTLAIALGTSGRLAAAAVFSNDSTATVTSRATWSCANENVAVVDRFGTVTGRATGATRVSATFGGKTGLADVGVTPGTLTRLEVTPPVATLPRGLTSQLKATGVFSDGTTQDLTAQVTWSAANPATASVSTAGLATALQAGTTTITARFLDKSAAVTLTVTAAEIVSVAVTPTNPSLAKGVSTQLTATGTFTDGSVQDVTSTVAWTSSDLTRATVSSGGGTSGLATALATGASIITATYPNTQISGSTTLTVTAAELVSIDVTPAAPSVPKGLKQQFTATGIYTDDSHVDITTAVTWSSSDTAKATISNASGSQGEATTLATGTTTIKATHAATQIEGSTTLTVTAATLVSIDVTPAAPSVAKGLKQQFTATGSYTDDSRVDITTAVTWTSTDTAKASVSNASGSQGEATTLLEGTTTITATYPNTTIADSATLTVGTPVLVSLAVTPTNASMDPRLLRRYTATGTYSDGATRDLTATVTWSSSDETKAIISNASGSEGQVTSVAVGASTITADAGSGISGGTTVTVTRPVIGFDDQVYAIALGADGTRYVGGLFENAGYVRGNAVAFDEASGQERAMPKVAGTVMAIVADGKGGWYLGGDFTHVGGVARNRLAHLLRDGTVDPNWNPNADSNVLALAVSADGNTVYAGGVFTSIGGQTRNHIAALDAATGTPTLWNPNASYDVYALAMSGSTVYAGGWFTSIGGQTRNRIAAIDAATGAATAWNPNANNFVNTLTVSGSTVYAGGTFTSIGGQTRNRIAALDAATGLATAWNPSASSTVYVLAVRGSTVYVGGYFTSIGGQSRNYIAALDRSSAGKVAKTPTVTVFHGCIGGRVLSTARLLRPV